MSIGLLVCGKGGREETQQDHIPVCVMWKSIERRSR